MYHLHWTLSNLYLYLVNCTMLTGPKIRQYYEKAAPDFGVAYPVVLIGDRCEFFHACGKEIASSAQLCIHHTSATQASTEKEPPASAKISLLPLIASQSIRVGTLISSPTP